MIYRIADFNIDIITQYSDVTGIFKMYLAKDASHVDFTVRTTDADIDHELRLADNIEQEFKHSREYVERLAVLRKVSAELLARDGFLMHGVFLEYEGKGYIFTAKSGVGKSTHALLWKEHFGDENVRIINGDKLLIRLLDGRFYAYGTPWCGKEGYNINTRCEISAICFISRGETNSIESISEEEALPKLLSQIMIADSANLAKQLDLAGTLLENVPMYHLRCNISPKAAAVAYEGMNKKSQG